MDHENGQGGILGLVSKTNVSSHAYLGLLALQHRGEAACSLTVHDKEIQTHRGQGLIRDVMGKEVLGTMSGNSGIGFVGAAYSDNAQPYEARTAFGHVALAYDGVISNAVKHLTRIEKEGNRPICSRQEEAVVLVLGKYLRGTGDMMAALGKLVKEIAGSYSMVIMMDCRVIGVRNPLGLTPMCIGRTENGYVIASESAAVDALGGEFIGEVAPGEIVEITQDKISRYRPFEPGITAICPLEQVHIMRPDSIMNGENVFKTRMRMGMELGREHPADADLVIPVPDSGRAQAQGYSAQAGIPVSEGLIKNRYSRSISTDPAHWTHHGEMNPMRNRVRGKRIVLVDNGILSGFTMRTLVEKLSCAGALEVHVRIASTPPSYPCCMGKVLSIGNHLIAGENDDLNDKVGANSFEYLSLRGLERALRTPLGQLCLGCIEGKSPCDLNNMGDHFG